MDAPNPATFTYEIIRPEALATAALRREWGLLDPNICGVRELEPSLIALRVTILDESGMPCETVDAAYYPEIRQIGVTGETPDVDAAGPEWISAPSIEAGIERWLRAR